MNNKFMTELEVEQDKEIQLLKSQLAEQEKNLQEFIKSNTKNHLRNDSDLCVYMAVEDYPYEVSSLLIGEEFVMTSLKYMDGDIIWDNDRYLYNSLLPLLRRYCSKNMFENDKIAIEELENDFPQEDFCKILEVLEKAENLGFFKNCIK